MERFEKINDGSFYVYFVVVFSVLFFGLWLLLKTMPIAVPEKVPALSPLPPNDLANFVKKEVQIQLQVQIVKQAEYVPGPASEYQIFYNLVKEKLLETKKPAEVLHYINGLKAVSAPLYLKYYRFDDIKLNEIRAAVRKAVLRAFQESGFYHYPNRHVLPV